MAEHHQVIIVGGGPAGISTLLWCHSLGLEAIILEQGTELGGQLLQMFHPVVDYPGLPNRTGPQIRDEFESHLSLCSADWRLNHRIGRLSLQAQTIDELAWDALVIASGARNRLLNVQGEADLVGNGISHSATMDAQRYAGRTVCVVGGGDSAFEDALIAAQSSPQVTLIHRSEVFRVRESWKREVLANPRIRIIANAEITSFSKRKDGDIDIASRNRATGGEEHLVVGGVFVRLGIQPNTEFLKGQVRLDEAGYVVTDATQRTSHGRVYAVGDVCRPACFSIATAVGHGAIAAKSIATAPGRQ